MSDSAKLEINKFIADNSAMIKFGKKRYSITSIDDALFQLKQYIILNDLKSELDFKRNDGVLFSNKEPFAKLAYNGTLWTLEGEKVL